LLVGCVREIKDNEYRVGLVPGGVESEYGPVAEARGVPVRPLGELLRG
jgi:alanine dehydrogenase